MTRGQKPGFLDKATLASRLGISEKDAKARSKQSMLAQAVREQRVTLEEVEASCAIRQSTTPMYLHSVIDNPAVLGAMERYVQAWSRLYRRGSFLANYIFMQHNPHPVIELPADVQQRQPYDRYQPRIQDTLQLFDFVTDPPNEPDVVKLAYKKLEEAESKLRAANKTLEAKRALLATPVASRMSEARAEAIRGKRQDGVQTALATVEAAEQCVHNARVQLQGACATAGWRQRMDRMPCLKQVFLPEFWPTMKQERHPWVEAAFQDVGQNALGHLAVPNWEDVMGRTGWSQALNRMGDKYAVNVAIQATAHLYRRAKTYMAGVQLAEPSTRKAMQQALNGQLGVLAVHNDDYNVLHTLRTVFGAETPDSRPSWSDAGGKLTPAKLDLHLFFTSQRVVEATFVPVGGRRRHFAYMDQKIALAMLPKEWVDKRTSDLNKPADSSLTLGEALGLTSDDIRRRRKLLRQSLRHKYKKRDTPKKKKLAKKWRQIGWSNVPKTAMFASLETDGVALRLCIGTPLNLDEVPPSKKKKVGKNDADELNLLRASMAEGVEPVFVAIDGGRAKIATAAISESAIQKPRTEVFTRRRYYWEMHHAQNKKFEARRRAGDNDLDAALRALADSSGVKNCQWQRFEGYLEVERAHWGVLEADGYTDRERALWRQRLFRFKRRSLDKLANRLIHAGDMRRPLVLGYGDAGFAPTGRGEKSVPTTNVTRALLRAKRRTQGRTIVMTGVWEFRTTLCCCACGSITSGAPCAPGQGTSRRLRLCTHCNESGDKRRDRDVQAARNILWLLQYMYYGVERPEYLCRAARSTSQAVDA